jgi:predicted P-loop ATPase
MPVTDETIREERERAEAEIRKQERRKAKSQPGAVTKPNGAGLGSHPIPTPTKADYMKGKSALASNVGNVLLALQQEPELMGAFGYDEMLRCEVLLRPLFRSESNFTPRPITDADVTSVQSHLQWMGFRRLGAGATHEAVNKHAREHSFHPVRDYLNRLRWDGERRVQSWLAEYLGAQQTEYTEQIGTMFLIGMVARILKPGCKLDYMVVLEGEQGALKSSACAVLAGSYFSDQLPDITTKESALHLRGRWLIEVAELRAYTRAAIDHFKEFLVRDTERYRPPWGRKEVHEPRQCVFVGTTNKSLYLRDETGNRRFWPVKCGFIDLDALRADRDQLLAEAVKLYGDGVHWWPDRAFEMRIAAAEQEKRFEVDAWEEKIDGYINGKQRATLWEIAAGCLGFEEDKDISRFGTADQRRVTAILQRLGWEPRRDMRARLLGSKKVAVTLTN